MPNFDQCSINPVGRPASPSSSLYSSPERSCRAHHCDAEENESSAADSGSGSGDRERDLRRSRVSAPAPPTGDHRLSP